MPIKLRTTALTPRQAMTAAVAEAKARQLSKIRELRLALRRAGLIGLDEQAKALGLPRSTTWKILKGGHKTSGFQQWSLVGCCPNQSCRKLSAPKYLNTCGRKPPGFMGTARENCLDSRLGFGAPMRWAICGDLGHPPDGLHAQAL